MHLLIKLTFYRWCICSICAQNILKIFKSTSSQDLFTISPDNIAVRTHAAGMTGQTYVRYKWGKTWAKKRLVKRMFSHEKINKLACTYVHLRSFLKSFLCNYCVLGFRYFLLVNLLFQPIYFLISKQIGRRHHKVQPLADICIVAWKHVI